MSREGVTAWRKVQVAGKVVAVTVFDCDLPIETHEFPADWRPTSEEQRQQRRTTARLSRELVEHPELWNQSEHAWHLGPILKDLSAQLAR